MEEPDFSGSERTPSTSPNKTDDEATVGRQDDNGYVDRLHVEQFFCAHRWTYDFLTG